MAAANFVDLSKITPSRQGMRFRNRTMAATEILHYGMRNPWRFSFDALTGGNVYR